MARTRHPRRCARETTPFTRSPYARRLRCEQLEDRRLLALLTVTTDQDVVDFNDGVLSLREAIFAANTVPGPDEIQFDFGHDGPATILLTQGELQITDSLTITGSGAELLSIDAQQQSRIFHAKGFVGDVTLSGMTLTKGRTTQVGYMSGGSALQTVTGVNLTIQGCTISGNSTLGHGARGGAISSFGNLTIRDSLIEGNSTEGDAAFGGGIFCYEISMSNSVVKDNHTYGFFAKGGGLFSQGFRSGPSSIVNSQVLKNSTFGGSSYGGGAYLGHASVTDSIINGNSTFGSSAKGGGLYLRGSIAITSSTISDNRTLDTLSSGGGIFSQGTLVIQESLVSGNSTNSVVSYGGGISLFGEADIYATRIIGNTTLGNGARAGAIYVGVLSSLVIDSCSIEMNSASGSGAYGGAIRSRGAISIKASRISGNQVVGDGSRGGGIYSESGSLSIIDSEVSHNSAMGHESFGGGIFTTGQTEIVRSTLTKNFVEGELARGGAIFGVYLTIVNSTISSSLVKGRHASAGGVFSIVTRGFHNTTIVNNQAIGENSFAGGIIFRNNAASISNSLIAGNLADTMSSDMMWIEFPPSIHFSIIGTNAGTTLIEAPVGSPDTNGNLIGGPIHGVIDPLLGPLADNGGPTLTHALLPGSPAINMGDPNAVAGQNGVPLFDQREAPFGRVAGGRIDIGAFETGPLVVDTLVDENDGDYSQGDFSLREAIDLANRLAVVDTIEFDPILTAIAGPLPPTILLTMGELSITDSLTINGPGAELLTLDASGSSGSIFVIDDLDVSFVIETNISGLTLTGATESAISSTDSLTLDSMTIRGNESFAGGAIRMSILRQAPETSLRVIGSILSENISRGRDAGAIYFRGYQGKLSIVDSIITGNSIQGFTLPREGSRGGGILIDGQDNDVWITKSKIEANQAANGGGLYISNRGTGLVTIAETTISKNIAIGRGGGIAGSDSRISIFSSSISNNQLLKSSSAPVGGGGIFLSGGEGLIIESTLISQNASTYSGGGILTLKVPMQITDSAVTENSAAHRGGGIFNFSGKMLLIERTEISGNTSEDSGGGISLVGVDSFDGNAFTITNSTISGNASFENGGGINSLSSALLVINSSISGNRARYSGGGIAQTNGSVASFAHTIITNNTSDANMNGSGNGGGIFGGPVSLDHTIVAGNHDNSGVANDIAGVFNSTYSLVGFGAQFLGPLADYGGPTLTHALLPGSPAINAGDPNLVQGQAGLPEFDQRGAPFARVVGGRIDIGAYESQPAIGSFHADFDGDGDRDGRDFLIWQRGVGISQNAQRSDGDATGNMAVDGNDLAVWRATYGNKLSTIDQALESFANLSAGVPLLFADHNAVELRSAPVEIEIAEIPNLPTDMPALKSQVRYFPTIYSSESRPADSPADLSDGDFENVLDRIFAIL